MGQDVGVAMDYSIGIDVGSSSVKATILTKDGTALDVRSAAYSTSHPHPGWAEQDPDDWWEAVGEVLGDLLSQVPEAHAGNTVLGLTGQMHTSVLRGADGSLLRPAIMWSDQRASAEVEELNARRPDLPGITGNDLVPAFTLAHLLWLYRHEPDLLRRAARVCVPKDDIRARLGAGWATDPSDASATAMLDTRAGTWDPSLVAETGLTVGVLPPVVPSSEVTGRISELPPGPASLERLLGMAVVTGAGDQEALAYALGATAPGDLVMALGTSGAAMQPSPVPYPGAFRHVPAETWLVLDSNHSAGLAVDWWSEVTGAPIQRLLDEATGIRAEGIAQGPVFLPYLQGHRTAQGAPGSLIGLHISHRRPDITLAVLAGIALEMRRLAENVNGGTVPPGAVTIGGGLSRSPVFRKILASTLNREVKSSQRDGCHGAAMIASPELRLSGAQGNTTPPGTELVSSLARLDERAQHWALLLSEDSDVEDAHKAGGK